MTKEQRMADTMAMIAALPIDPERLEHCPDFERLATAISKELGAAFDPRQCFLNNLSRAAFSPDFCQCAERKTQGIWAIQGGQAFTGEMAAIDYDAIKQTLPRPDWEATRPGRVEERLALIAQAQGLEARHMAALLAVLPLAKYASAEMKAIHEQTMTTALYARWLLGKGYIPPEGCGVPVDLLQGWMSKKAAGADERTKDFEAWIDIALAPFQSALLRRVAPEAFVERPYEDAPAPADVEMETRLRATIDAMKPADMTPRGYLRALWREAFPDGFPTSKTVATTAKEPDTEADKARKIMRENLGEVGGELIGCQMVEYITLANALATIDKVESSCAKRGTMTQRKARFRDHIKRHGVELHKIKAQKGLPDYFDAEGLFRAIIDSAPMYQKTLKNRVGELLRTARAEPRFIVKR